MLRQNLCHSKMSVHMSTAIIAVLVLRTALLTLHLVSSPHAVDSHTGHLVHLHEHHAVDDHKTSEYESFEEQSRSHIQAKSHSCCDHGIHNCPYSHFLHQPSSQTLNLVGENENFPPSQQINLFDEDISFVRENLYLLAPMNPPPV